MDTQTPATDAVALHSHPQRRFDALDGWRGVVALWIALFHLTVTSHFLALPLVRDAYIMVDFFFVLSGFVITHTYASRLNGPAQFGDFAARRFARLWPLHVTVLAAFLVVELMKGPLASVGLMSFNAPPFASPNDVATLVPNIALLTAMGLTDHSSWNFPSWSISAEFWTYLVFAVTVLVGRRKPIVTAIGAAIAILGAVVVVTASRGDMDLSYDFGFFRCLYGFFLGCVLYRVWESVQHRVTGMAWLEAPVVIVYVGFVCLVGRTPLGFLAPVVSAAVVFVFAFEAGTISRLMQSRPIAWLGKRSYTIYMLHAFIAANLILRPMQILEKLLHHPLTAIAPAGERVVVLNDEVLSGTLTLAYIAIIVALAAAVYDWIELPGQKLFIRLLTRRAARVKPVLQTA